MDNILNEIKSERQRQNEKFGQQNHSPIEWMAILSEEVGEASKEALGFHFEYGLERLKEQHMYGAVNAILDDRLNEYRKELIQVAAVAVQMIESLDRNRKQFLYDEKYIQANE